MPSHTQQSGGADARSSEYDRAKVDADWEKRWNPAWDKEVFKIHDKNEKFMKSLGATGLKLKWVFDVTISSNGTVVATLNEKESQFPRDTSPARQTFRDKAAELKKDLEGYPASYLPCEH